MEAQRAGKACPLPGRKQRQWRWEENQVESTLSSFPALTPTSTTVMAIKIIFCLSDVFLPRSSNSSEERTVLIFTVLLLVGGREEARAVAGE